jgi:hypothetical protein
VWLSKIGMEPPRDETPDMRRGRRLEDVAASFFSEVTGLRVRRQPLRRHPNYPWLLASIDRQVLSTDDRKTGPLEIKVPRSHNFARWRREGLPDYVVLQGQHEAGVWGADLSAYAIYNPDGDELLTPVVAFDAGVWDQIVERSHDWWQKHVVGGVAPTVESTPEIEALPVVEGDVPFHRIESEAFQQVAAEWLEARDIQKEAEATRDWARDRVLEAMGDQPGIYEGAGVRFYYTRSDGRRSFQVKDLEAAGALDPLAVSAVVAELYKHWETGVVDVLERLKECRLDLDRFYKVGSPYMTLKGYRTRED